ncbi:MAG: phytoene desaturase [Chitinophagaceae bacterium]|nr:phytoene desaturase [Chitinophagaceae bacterium]
MSKIVIIGAGFSGLSAAAYLSAAGHEVHVLEKNAEYGGRARQFETGTGYVFDMGPSWYWMPGVFEKFFADFGYRVSDLYELKLLDPAFDVVFAENDTMHIPENFDALCSLFDSVESGAGEQLKKFMDEAEYKYKAGMENLVYKPGISITEFADMNLIKGVFRLQVFSAFSKHVRKYFSHPKLIALMEFPILFLGAMPEETPALYSLMNYAGLKLKTWYPAGGFGKVVMAMADIAQKNGATFHMNAAVHHIGMVNNLAKNVVVKGEIFECDAVIATADYHHVESKLLDEGYRNYDEKYWEHKTLAPSCLIFYIGINKKIQSLNHHTLFFDEALSTHSQEIYKYPQWPTRPLFYVCCPSKSDDTVAPQGNENLFILMPIATGLNDSEDIRERYFKIMMKRLEKQTGEDLLPYVNYKKSYCLNDFIADYNSYKGNAYGLANTLKQTAFLKPKIRNKKVSNLFYAGQLTVPGPGVPPSIISGKIASEQLIKYLNKN